MVFFGVFWDDSRGIIEICYLVCEGEEVYFMFFYRGMFRNVGDVFLRFVFVGVFIWLLRI